MQNIHVFVLVLFCMVGAYCGVVVFPQNKAVIRGDRMSFECRTTDGSTVREWFFIRSSKSKEEKIFSNWNTDSRQVTDPRFGVDVDQYGSGTLYLNGTRLEDGGTYGCAVDTGNEIPRFRAELIVLDSEPECNVTDYNGRRIRIECSVHFTGNWAPTMEWRHLNSPATAFEDGILFTDGISIHSSITQVLSRLDVTLYSPRDSIIVSCKIFFQSRDVQPNRSASNVPDFVRIWRSQVFGFSEDVVQTTQSFSVATDAPLLHSSNGSPPPPPPPPSTGPVSEGIATYMISVLTGGAVLLVLIILLGIIVCIIRKRKTRKYKRTVVNNREVAPVDVIGSHIYDSILLYDEHGYRIPVEESEVGDSKAEVLPPGSVSPYYETKAVETQTLCVAKDTGKSHQAYEAHRASTENYGYEKVQKTLDKIDASKISFKHCQDASRYSSIEIAKDETTRASYLQIIGDIDDTTVIGSDQTTRESRDKISEISPVDSTGYTDLVFSA